MSNINNHNHIVIGIGGLSSRIIDMIYEKSQANTVFALDTDVNSLMILKHLPAKNRIALSSISSVKDMLAETGNEDGWFPENELIYNFTLAEGCGLNRPCSMLAFYNVLKRGSLRRFEESLTKILNDAVPFEKVSISVITSLFGSTGAGLFLPFAVYIRQFASSIRSDINIDVRGYFLVSESFMNSINYSKEIADTQKSMVYACLQEIHSINNGNFEKMNKFFKKFGTTDNDDELPYDYCFFYDHLPENNTNLFAEMIVQQLFSPAAEVVNAKLENSIQIARRRNNVALYANSDVFKICPDKTMPEKFEEMLSDIAIENSIVSCFIPVNQKDKYKVSSRAVHTEYVEDADYISVNRIMTNITLEKFYYCQKDGEYETKYKQRCEREKNNKVFTPHLTCEWDNLPLICDDNICCLFG